MQAGWHGSLRRSRRIPRLSLPIAHEQVHERVEPLVRLLSLLRLLVVQRLQPRLQRRQLLLEPQLQPLLEPKLQEHERAAEEDRAQQPDVRLDGEGGPVDDPERRLHRGQPAVPRSSGVRRMTHDGRPSRRRAGPAPGPVKMKM